MKLRLSKDAHDKLVTLLASEQKHLFQQENFFFDGVNQELTSKRCVMRLRFFNTDEKAVLTVKGKMKVEDGVGRAQEDEDEVDPVAARGCVQFLLLSLGWWQLVLVCSCCDVTGCPSSPLVFSGTWKTPAKCWLSKFPPSTLLKCAILCLRSAICNHGCSGAHGSRHLCSMAPEVAELKGLGGFKNIRKVCNWEGFTLEIDETCLLYTSDAADE